MTAADNEQQHRESIEHIADRAAAKAVRNTLQLIGVDLSDPIKAQAEFAALRAMANPTIQADLAFLRRLHGATVTVTDTSWRTIIRILVTATIGGAAIVTKDFWLYHLSNLWKP